MQDFQNTLNLMVASSNYTVLWPFLFLGRDMSSCVDLGDL